MQPSSLPLSPPLSRITNQVVVDCALVRLMLTAPGILAASEARTIGQADIL